MLNTDGTEKLTLEPVDLDGDEWISIMEVRVASFIVPTIYIFAATLDFSIQYTYYYGLSIVQNRKFWIAFCKHSK